MSPSIASKIDPLSDSSNDSMRPPGCNENSAECIASFRIIRVMLKEVKEDTAKTNERLDMLVEKVLIGNGRPSLIARLDLVESKVDTVDKRTQLPTVAALLGSLVGAVFAGIAAYVVFRFTH